MSNARKVALAVAVLVGVAFGLGAFTFVYARGASYLTNDPAACANCHTRRAGERRRPDGGAEPVSGALRAVRTVRAGLRDGSQSLPAGGVAPRNADGRLDEHPARHGLGRAARNHPYRPGPRVHSALRGTRFPAGLSSAALARRIDADVERMTAAGYFSGAVMVTRNGSVLLSQGYGYADAGRSVPIRPDTRLRIASLGKPCTAVAVLQLADAGRLSLDWTTRSTVCSASPGGNGLASCRGSSFEDADRRSFGRAQAVVWVRIPRGRSLRKSWFGVWVDISPNGNSHPQPPPCRTGHEPPTVDFSVGARDWSAGRARAAPPSK
jgi:hypothetical protein